MEIEKLTLIEAKYLIVSDKVNDLTDLEYRNLINHINTLEGLNIKKERFELKPTHVVY